ncbi:MAG: twin-arginine translocase TatA/TatE family subunit [Planctomycetota bacterium]|jgi:sec-independent protein translocase protein TatA|nr:twin-arginine translocase TatA/TatE family subunit [Planctomycetota bacterium]
MSVIPAFFQSLGWSEILIVGVAGVLLFGRRLPDLGRTLGKSLVSFRKGMTEMKDEIVKGVEEPLAPALPATDAAPPVITETVKIGDHAAASNNAEKLS